MRQLFLFCLVVVLVTLAVLPAQNEALAQADRLTLSYQAADDSFGFEYPRTWDVLARRGLVYAYTDGVTVSIVGPQRLASAGLTRYATPPALLAALQPRLGLSDGMVEELRINYRAAARLDAPSAAGYPGFLMAVTLRNGRLVVADVRFTEGRRVNSERDALALVRSLDAPFGVPPRQLEADPDTRFAIIGELEAAGLIPAGARTLFVATRSFREGQDDALFVSLASESPAQNVVMGGTLTFSPGGGGYEACSLGARIVSDADGVISAYLEVGVNTDGSFFYVDHTGQPETSRSGSTLSRVPAGEHQIVLVALEDTLTVYLDGKRIFDRVTVSARQGSYGIGLISGAARARCEGRNLWAYEVPDFEPGMCLLTASGNVNRRVGAGLDYESVGTLAAGQSMVAVARSLDTNGETWWLMDDGSFVKDDVVRLAGYCASLPLYR